MAVRALGGVRRSKHRIWKLEGMFAFPTFYCTYLPPALYLRCDWPSQKNFVAEFPELFDDFLLAVFHFLLLTRSLNGADLTPASHFSWNVIAPDSGDVTCVCHVSYHA